MKEDNLTNEDYDLNDPDFVYSLIDHYEPVQLLDNDKKDVEVHTVPQKKAYSTRLKAERDEKVCTLYNAGASIPEIIKETNVPESTIFRILKKNNVQLRDGRSTSKQREDKVITLYESNTNTIKGIMSETGIKSEQTIYRILKERNIPLRKK